MFLLWRCLIIVVWCAKVAQFRRIALFSRVKYVRGNLLCGAEALFLCLCPNLFAGWMPAIVGRMVSHLYFIIHMNTSLFGKREVLTFRRFRRKGWALFAALGREVRIGVLLAGTLLSAQPCLEAGAQHVSPVADDDEAVESDTVPLAAATVSTSRIPLALGVAARQVTTLTRTDIAAAGFTAVTDLLKLASSADVRQRGGFGIQQDISLEGGTFDQTLLLINGIPYVNPQTGHNAAHFPFSTEDVEQVEIVAGPASRIFGSGAFNGAINFVTRRYADGGKATLQVGSYGTLLARARQSFSFGNRWYTSLSASGRRSDGAVRNGDFKGGSLYWQGGYEHGRVRIDAQAGHVADDFGANTFYSPTNDRQWEATRRTLASLSAEIKGRFHILPKLSWTRSTDHYQWLRGTHTAENFNRTDVFHLGVDAGLGWSLGRTAVGAAWRDEKLLSSNLGKPIDEKDWVRIHGQDGSYYTRSARRTSFDLYGEHTFLLPHWTIAVGVLATHHSTLDEFFHLFPGVDVSFRPSDDLRFYASYNTALRLPTFTELWYRSPSQEGNTGLKPERNTQWRLGATWRVGAWTCSANAHLSCGRDMIDWVMYSPDDVYHAAAFRLRSAGFSVDGVVNLRSALGEQQPLRRVRAEYSYLYQHRDDDADVFRSNYQMNYLRHKLIIILSHDLPFGVSADWTLRVQNRAGAYQEYEGLEPTGLLRSYGTNALIDLRLFRRVGRVTLSCDLTNLTCRRYVDVAGVPQPGLLVLFGAGLKW